jgi:hypothetical protein
MRKEKKAAEPLPARSEAASGSNLQRAPASGPLRSRAGEAKVPGPARAKRTLNAALLGFGVPRSGSVETTWTRSGGPSQSYGEKGRGAGATVLFDVVETKVSSGESARESGPSRLRHNIPGASRHQCAKRFKCDGLP